MAFGDTGAPTMAQPSLASLGAPDPAATSPSPALDALEAAFQKGLIGPAEIQQLVQQGQDNAAASANDASTIKLAPQQTALASDQIQAARSLIPGQTQLAKTQTALGTAQAQGQLYPAQYMASVLKQAYGGDASGLVNPAPTAAGAPPTAATAPGQPPPASGGLPQDALNSIRQNFTTSQFNANWLQQPQWQSLSDLAKTKQGGEAAMYDSSGYLKPFSQAMQDVSGLPPVLNQDARASVLNQMNSVADIVSKVPGVLDILNNPNSRVGPGMGQGEPITNMLNSWRSKFAGVPVLGAMTGANSAADKVSDQNKLMQFAADQIQSTIRSLAGTGNRVMQAEVRNEEGKQGLFYKAMPGLNDPTQTWKDYLTNRLQLLRAGIQSEAAPLTPADQQQYLPVLGQLDQSIDSLKGTAPGNPYAGTTKSTGAAPAPGTAAPAPGTAAAAPVPSGPVGGSTANPAPLPKSAAEYQAIPAGSYYMGSDGQVHIKGQ